MTTPQTKKYLYTKNTIEFYKNVAPFPLKPLWEIDFIARSFEDIPPEYLLEYSDEEINSMSWFFEDIIDEFSWYD